MNLSRVDTESVPFECSRRPAARRSGWATPPSPALASRSSSCCSKLLLDSPCPLPPPSCLQVHTLSHLSPTCKHLLVTHCPAQMPNHPEPSFSRRAGPHCSPTPTASLYCSEGPCNFFLHVIVTEIRAFFPITIPRFQRAGIMV